MNEKLLFRRQFVITKRANKLDSWKETNLFDDYNLYSHPDINILDISMGGGREQYL